MRLGPPQEPSGPQACAVHFSFLIPGQLSFGSFIWTRLPNDGPFSESTLDPALDPTMALASLDVAGPALARPRLLCWSGNSSCCRLQHKVCFSANAKPIREATTATCVLFETESLRMISRTSTFTVDSGRFSARLIILFGSPRYTPSRTDCCRPLSSRRGKDEDKAVFAADVGSPSISSPSTSWIQAPCASRSPFNGCSWERSRVQQRSWARRCRLSARK